MCFYGPNDGSVGFRAHAAITSLGFSPTDAARLALPVLKGVPVEDVVAIAMSTLPPAGACPFRHAFPLKLLFRTNRVFVCCSSAVLSSHTLASPGFGPIHAPIAPPDDIDMSQPSPGMHTQRLSVTAFCLLLGCCVSSLLSCTVHLIFVHHVFNSDWPPCLSHSFCSRVISVRPISALRPHTRCTPQHAFLCNACSYRSCCSSYSACCYRRRRCTRPRCSRPHV